MTNYFNQYIISNPRLLFYPFLRSRIINLKFSSIFCLQLVRQFDTLLIFSPLIIKSEFVTRAKLSHVYPDSYGWRRIHGVCVRACVCVLPRECKRFSLRSVSEFRSCLHAPLGDIAICIPIKY